MRQHKLTWIVVIKSTYTIAAISWLPPLISHLFSHHSEKGHTFFLRLGCFWVDNKYCRVISIPIEDETSSQYLKQTCFFLFASFGHVAQADFKVSQTQHGIRYIHKLCGWRWYSSLTKLVYESCSKVFQGIFGGTCKEKPQYKGKHKLNYCCHEINWLTKDSRHAVIMKSQREDKIQAAILLQQRTTGHNELHKLLLWCTL